MKEQIHEVREIHVNDPDANMSKRFTTNRVHTTKYTPLTFLPQFLWNELRRPANIFFCLIIFIQVNFIYIFLFLLFLLKLCDPTEPDKYSTILPLSGILLFTACKEIYEDSVKLKKN